MPWADLNERQQQYVQAIYDQDQENERHEKSQWTRGGRPRPAIEWRWMYYGIMPETGSDSPLRRRLKVADLVDPGTGATFQALEARGYILCQYDWRSARLCADHERGAQAGARGNRQATRETASTRHTQRMALARHGRSVERQARRRDGIRRLVW